MVEGGETFHCVSEDVLEVEHLLTETKYESPLEDDINYLNSVDTEKYLMLEHFPSSDEFYGTAIDFGITNTEATVAIQSDVQLPVQCLDSMLLDHEKDHVNGNLSVDRSDYIFDSEFAEKDSSTCFDFPSIYCLDNSTAEYSQMLKSESGVGEMLNLTNAHNLADGTSNQMHSCESTVHEVHDALRDACGCTSAVDKQQLKQCIYFGFNSLIDLDYSSIHLKTEFLSDDNEDMVMLPIDDPPKIFGTFASTLDQKMTLGKSLDKGLSDKDALTANDLAAGRFSFVELEGTKNTPVTRKRKRKPTRRYIEESSDVRSREHTGKFGPPSSCPLQNIWHIRAHASQWKKSAPEEHMFSEDSSSVSNNHMPNDVQLQRGRPRKNFNFIVKDFKARKGHGHNSSDHTTVCSSMPSESTDEDSIVESPRIRYDKCGARRKHHRLWTLTEVTKLIEGVSRYGVGRWTDIKRLLFSSSAYRTSVDLKDKWRNLLRASGVHVHGKKDLETRKKHLPGPVPQSVLRRVRDLAIIHPYPRKRKAGSMPLLRRPAASVTDATADTVPCSNNSRKTTAHNRRNASSALH